MNTEDWVEVARFRSLLEAEVAKTKLLSDNIPAYITKDDQGGMLPSLQFIRGARLFVAKSLLQEAMESLGIERSSGI